MSGFISEQGKNLSDKLSEMGSALKEDFDISHPIDSSKKALGDGAAAASNIATTFIKGLYKRIDQGLKTSMEKNSKSIILRIGRYQLPPCFPSSVSWNFDFTQVDEYGFPRGGTITFEGLQSPKCGELTDIGLLS